MKISKDLIYILVIVGIGLFSYLFLYKPLDKLNLDYGLKIQEKQLKIEQLENKILEKDSVYKTIEIQRDSVLTIIENRKEKIKIIYKNYDQKIKNINNLNTDSTISLFSSWIR